MKRYSISKNVHLKSIIDFSFKHSEYYKHAFKNLDYLFLDELPLLDSDLLLSNLPPAGNGVLTTSPMSAFTFATSGTGGSKKYVYRTFEETGKSALLISKGFSDLVNSGSTVVSLLHYGNLWAAAISFGKAFEMVDCNFLPVGSEYKIKELANILIEFNVNTLVGVPSQVIALANYLNKEKINIKLDYIFTGGEPLYQSALNHLQKTFLGCKFHSLGYAINEVGPIGYQAPDLNLNQFYVHEPEILVEVINPTTRKPCEIGEVGEIVVTNTYFNLMPIIRYRTGDLGREIIENDSNIKHENKIIELSGRANFRFKLGDDFVDFSSIQKIIYEVLGEKINFCISLKLERSLDKLIVIIDREVVRNTVDIFVKKERVLDKIYSLSHLWEQLEKGMIARIEVFFVESVDMPKSTVSGKIMQVQDLR